MVGRLTSFVEAQVQTRSLTPQEGDSTDAVLSRAEAALKDTDLDTALSELQGLPEAARTAMGAWLTDAEARQAALAAYKTLRPTAVTTN